ncbi:FG-GAP-like repeat-containing protein [Polaribacter sp.]|uniref:FG-GAP-like repeat-containing protein n=2 Tax=Polaribacter sp. TaxID=1920175 RepID=UPI0040481604
MIKFRLIRHTMVFLLFFQATFSIAQVTTQWGPDGYVKIEEGSGGFIADLDSGDRFARDHDQAGDINGDGVIDLIIGARSDDDGATDAGAAYIVFINSDGTVKSNQKISMLEGGFNETLLANNFFGYGVAGIGDYDNDGIPDVAISAPASSNRALYIIHLNSNGTVKSFVKNSNIIAQGLTAIGDLNNDGRIDLVACDPSSDIGGNNIGAISILFLNSSSQVIPEQTVLINPASGGLGSGLVAGDEFGGREVAMLGDIDGDGTKEMAVGAFMSDGGKGAIWILSLDNTTYNVVSKLKITEGLNGFNDILDTELNPNGTFGAQFGHAMCAAGDLNGDGIIDLITGANQQGLGDAYILYLNNDKTVKTYTKIDETQGGFNLVFDQGSEERFARSISFVGDLRGDGSIAVNFGGGVGLGGTGSLYLLFLKPCEFNQKSGLNFWNGGTTHFSNWNHMTQTVSDPLTFEQCTFKAFETDAPYITYKESDGRCICKSEDAVLSNSTEGSLAFINYCYSGDILSTDLFEFNNQTIIYPNPTNSELILKTNHTSFSERDILQVFNIFGKKLYSSTISSTKTLIDLSKLPQGTYILKTNINGVQNLFKILKD